MQKHLRFLFFIAGFYLCTQLHAQGFVRVGNYRPTGELGFVMKPAICFEAGLSGTIDDDNKWRAIASVSFVKLEPRMDTFPVVTVMTSGSNTTILPGKQSFSKYNLITLSVGFDYPFYYNDKFAVYGGFDLQAGGASVSYYENVPTYKEESYDGGGVFIGIRLRAGADYYFNDNWSVFASAQRHGILVTEPAGIFAANDYGVGLRYMLD